MKFENEAKGDKWAWKNILESQIRVLRDFAVALSAGIFASLPRYLENFRLSVKLLIIGVAFFFVYGLLYHIDLEMKEYQ